MSDNTNKYVKTSMAELNIFRPNEVRNESPFLGIIFK